MSIRGAVLIVCALVGVATADTPQQQADKLFAEGRDLMLVKKDAKAACEKFEAAIQLDPTATGTMLNLGLCYETLGKYAKSIFWFRKAQAAAAEAHLAEYEDAAKQHTVTIAPKVPNVRIDVSQPDAEVRIDGVKIEATEYGKVEVDPGSHEVVGRAPGKKKVVQTVDLKEGESKPVSIALTEAAVPVYVDKGKGRRRGGLILGGVGVVTLVGVGIYGFVQRDKFFDPSLSEPDQNAAAKDLRTFGTTAFIVGVAAVTAGAILYFTAPRRERVSDGTAFVPVVGDDQVGLAAVGRF